MGNNQSAEVMDEKVLIIEGMETAKQKPKEMPENNDSKGWLPQINIAHTMSVDTKNIAERALNNVEQVKGLLERFAFEGVPEQIRSRTIDKVISLLFCAYNLYYVEPSLRKTLIMQQIAAMGYFPMSVVASVATIIWNLTRHLVDFGKSQGDSIEDTLNTVWDSFQLFFQMFRDWMFPEQKAQGEKDKKIPKPGMLHTWAKTLGDVKHIGDGLQWIHKFCWWVVSWVYYKVTGKFLVTESAKIIASEAERWIERAQMLREKNQQFLEDPQLCSAVVNHYKDGVKLQVKLMKDESIRNNFRPLFDQIKDFSAVASRCETLVSTAQTRIEPVFIQFVGDPIAGKTTCSRIFGADLYQLWCAHRGMPCRQNQNVRYEKKELDAFWEWYQGQFVTFWDDIFQINDKEKGGDQALEIIYIVNSAAYPLNMAALENKGKTFFISPVVIATSNAVKTPAFVEERLNSTCQVQGAEKKAVAFKRRRTLLVKVIPKNPDRESGLAKPSGGFSREAWEFHEYDRVVEEPTGKVYSYEEILTICWNALKDKIDKKNDIDEWIKKNPFDVSKFGLVAVKEQVAQMMRSDEFLKDELELEKPEIESDGEDSLVAQFNFIKEQKPLEPVDNLLKPFGEEEDTLGGELIAGHADMTIYEKLSIFTSKFEADRAAMWLGSAKRAFHIKGFAKDGKFITFMVAPGDEMLVIRMRNLKNYLIMVGSANSQVRSIMPHIRLSVVFEKKGFMPTDLAKIYALTYFEFTFRTESVNVAMENCRKELKKSQESVSAINKMMADAQAAQSEEESKHRGLKVVLGLIAGLGALGLAYGATKSYRSWYHMAEGDLGSKPTPPNTKKVKEFYEKQKISTRRAWAPMKQVGQGSSEKLVEECYANNMARITMPGPKGGMCGIFFTHETVGSLPWHMTIDASDDPEDEIKLVLYREHVKGIHKTYAFKNKDCIFEHDTKNDLMRIRFPKQLQSFPDLRKHLCPEDKIGKAAISVSTLYYLTKEMKMKNVQLTDCRLSNTVRYRNHANEYHTNPNAMAYTAKTGAGSCGGIIVVENDNLQEKILGIQASGNGIDQASGVTLPQEMYLEKEQEGQVELSIAKTEEQEFAYAPGVTYLGQLTNNRERRRFPDRTRIVPSLMHAAWSFPTSHPVNFEKGRHRCKKENLCGHCTSCVVCHKYGHPTEHVKIAPAQACILKVGKPLAPRMRQDLLERAGNLAFKPIGFDVPPLDISWSECLNGVSEWKFSPKVNASSSGGFREGGRWGMTGGKEDFVTMIHGKYELLPLAKQEADEYWTDLSQPPEKFEDKYSFRSEEKVKAPFIGEVNGKDERRALPIDPERPYTEEELKEAFKKVNTPRPFVNLQFKTWITGVRIFAGFLECIGRSRLRSGIAKGLDPHSREWNAFIMRWLEVGERGNDLDASQWDWSIHDDLLREAIRQIELWFERASRKWNIEFTVEKRNRLKNWLKSVLFGQTLIFLKDVIETIKGMLSGCLLTFDLNSLCERITQFYLVLERIVDVQDAFWSEQRELVRMLIGDPGEEDINRIVRAIVNMVDEELEKVFFPVTGGDDVVNVLGKCMEWYTNDMIVAGGAKYGYTFTPPDKKSEFVKNKPIGECIFLKRTPRFEKGLWFAPMKLEDIWEPMYWQNQKEDPKWVVVERVEVALHELFQHGKEVFDREREKIMTWCDKHHCGASFPTYSDFWRGYQKGVDFTEIESKDDYQVAQMQRPEDLEEEENCSERWEEQNKFKEEVRQLRIRICDIKKEWGDMPVLKEMKQLFKQFEQRRSDPTFMVNIQSKLLELVREVCRTPGILDSIYEEKMGVVPDAEFDTRMRNKNFHDFVLQWGEKLNAKFPKVGADVEGDVYANLWLHTRLEEAYLLSHDYCPPIIMNEAYMAMRRMYVFVEKMINAEEEIEFPMAYIITYRDILLRIVMQYAHTQNDKSMLKRTAVKILNALGLDEFQREFLLRLTKMMFEEVDDYNFKLEFYAHSPLREIHAMWRNMSNMTVELGVDEVSTIMAQEYLSRMKRIEQTNDPLEEIKTQTEKLRITVKKYAEQVAQMEGGNVLVPVETTTNQLTTITEPEQPVEQVERTERKWQPFYYGTDPYRTNNMGGVLEREYRIGQFTWSGNDATNTLISELKFPYALLNVATNLVEKLNRWEYLRGDMEIMIKANGTRFHFGMLLVGWLPHSNARTDTTGANMKVGNVYSLSSCNAMLLSANSPRETKLTLPFVNPNAYWKINEETENVGYIGSVFIRVLCPLKNTMDAGTPSITLSVFARFKETEIAGPTLHTPSSFEKETAGQKKKHVAQSDQKKDVVQPSQVYPHWDEQDPRWNEFEREYQEVVGILGEEAAVELFAALLLGDLPPVEMIAQSEKKNAPKKEQAKKSESGSLSDTLNATSDIAMKVAQFGAAVPEIGLAAGAVGEGLKLAGGLAKAFGFNKPDSVMAPQPVLQNSMPNNALMEGMYSAQQLYGVPSNGVTQDSMRYRRQLPEDSILALAMKPGLVEVFSLSTSVTEGEVFKKFHVTPTTCMTLHSTDAGEVNQYKSFNTPMSLMAARFKQWRGGVKYLFLVSASSLLSGDIRVSWHPTYSEIPSSFTLGEGDFVSEVFHFEGDTVIMFSIPYLQNKMWKQVENSWDKHDYGTNGAIALSIVNRIAAASTVGSTTVSIAMFVAADDDMCFQFPVEGYSPSGYHRGIVQSGVWSLVLQEQVAQNEGGDNASALNVEDAFRKPFPPLIPASKMSFEKVTHGEEYKSVTTLMKRFVFLETVTIMDLTQFNVPIRTKVLTETDDDFIRLMMTYFMYNAGGFEVRYLNDKETSGRIFATIVDNFQGSPVDAATYNHLFGANGWVGMAFSEAQTLDISFPYINEGTFSINQQLQINNEEKVILGLWYTGGTPESVSGTLLYAVKDDFSLGWACGAPITGQIKDSSLKRGEKLKEEQKGGGGPGKTPNSLRS
jgi:hypothetical protein